MSKLNVVAIFNIKPEFDHEFQHEFKKLVIGSRQEEGNIRYELNQDLSDPYTYVFVEIWASQSAFDAHNKEPHYQNFAKFVVGKVNHSTVHIMKTHL